MAHQVERAPLQFNYGHDEERVVIVCSQPVTNIGLTPDEADTMCAAIQAAKKQFLEYRASKGN